MKLSTLKNYTTCKAEVKVFGSAEVIYTGYLSKAPEELLEREVKMLSAGKYLIEITLEEV